MPEELDVRKLVAEYTVPVVASNLTVAMYLSGLLKALKPDAAKEAIKDKEIKRDVLITFNNLLPDVESYIPIEWRLDRLTEQDED